ncbi:MAG: hypothetical protein ABSF23_14755 [Terracidiphilus sp.]|jgi:hypothetical protein
MMARAQITLEPEFQRRARQRASDLGVSFAAYIRGLVVRDLSHPKTVAGIESIFDLASSGGSDIAKEKHSMVEEAFDFEAASRPRGKPQQEDGPFPR